jgi:hypothetical protein
VQQRRAAQLEAEEQQQPPQLTAADRKAQDLHGRLVTRVFTGQDGKPSTFWGKLSFRGAGAGTQNLLVTYSDGDSETCSIAQLKQRAIKLLPAGTLLPSSITIPLPGMAQTLVAAPVLSSSDSAAPLPGTWQLGSPAAVLGVLQLLMPAATATQSTGIQHQSLDSSTAQHSAAATAQAVAAARTASATPATALIPDSRVPITVHEVVPLLQAVNFGGYTKLLDPFASTSSKAFQHMFQHQGYTVTCSASSLGAEDSSSALQPGYYSKQQPQVVISSPPVSLLDVVVPLAARMCSVVACMYVPSSWLSTAHLARQQWLQQLQQQGRVCVVAAVPSGSRAEQHVWLLIFQSAAMYAQMLRPTAAVLPVW